MTSSESDEHLPSRKRTRRSISGEEGGAAAAGEKKSRGRPRVDAQDATAADRRRTQIRLAQRAYRQRKETTIASLKAENAQLQATIEEMNKTFARLKESTLESGVLQVNPSLSQDFKFATESFLTLAKSASEGRVEEVDEVEETREGTGTSLSSRKANPAEAEPQPVGWGYSRMNLDANSGPAHFAQMHPGDSFSHVSAFDQSGTADSVARRRQYTMGEVLDQSRSSGNASEHDTKLLPFGILDLNTTQPFHPPNPRMYPVSIPSPNVTPPPTRLSEPLYHLPNPLTLKNLSHLTTQSLDAPSFAMRLSRAAAETAFQLLIVADARPAAMSYIFRFQLPTASPEQLLARFRLLVSRPPGETLDNWDIPYIHLGGSGTHYPRKDATGQIVRIKNSWTAQPIGTPEDKRAALTNVEDGRQICLEGVDFTGLDGDWFDAHDVQGYLEEQYSCKLFSKSLFVECELGEEEEETFSRFRRYEPITQRVSGENSSSPSLSHKSMSTVSSSSAAMTPPPNILNLSEATFNHSTPFSQAHTQDFSTDYSKFNSSEGSFDQNLSLYSTAGVDYGWQGASGWSGSLNHMPAMLKPKKKKKKKKAWVDVHKLIDELLKNGVCLGRSPAFQKKDVQAAFQRARVRAC